MTDSTFHVPNGNVISCVSFNYCILENTMKKFWGFDSWSSGSAFVSGAGDLSFKFRAVKSDTVLPTARHRCDVSSKEAVLPGRNDAEMSPVNSLQASAYYSEHNKDLI